MWITIFELPDGDIETVELHWDKQCCYERVGAEECGLDEDGYVKREYDSTLGKFRIIEIKDENINEMFMFVLNKFIIRHDPKYLTSQICEKYMEEWLCEEYKEEY